MIKIVGPREMSLSEIGSGVINTTSRAAGWSRGLSPMLLGPVKLWQGAVCDEARNVENCWQYSKVYSPFADDNGEPLPSYFTWAKSGFEKQRADRYPAGKGAIPLYSYWNNKKLKYIDARKEIYIPLYSGAVVKSTAFGMLKDIYERTESLILWDFDGYDYLSLGMTLKDVVEDSKRKMGHAFVLAMMLENMI